VRDAPVSRRLPDFPWDQLTEYAAQAGAHRDGIVDLSIGTPVDPTPDVVRRALEAASDSPGDPRTAGLPQTRRAAVDWLARRHAVTGLTPDAVLPVIGTKELVASLPVQLGSGAVTPSSFPSSPTRRTPSAPRWRGRVGWPPTR
jgi:aspartate/methionine/tyrosine aminotransferase